MAKAIVLDPLQISFWIPYKLLEGHVAGKDLSLCKVPWYGHYPGPDEWSIIDLDHA
jgi:hypothetical protein